jgi:hypothetical protein
METLSLSLEFILSMRLIRIELAEQTHRLVLELIDLDLHTRELIVKLLLDLVFVVGPFLLLLLDCIFRAAGFRSFLTGTHFSAGIIKFYWFVRNQLLCWSVWINLTIQ